MEIKDPKNFYFPELDGLRFFAFLLVFFHHHTLLSNIPYFSVIHAYGWIGVDLFFILSAFLLSKLLRAEYNLSGSISYKSFYYRRILRICPLYYMYITFSALLFFFLPNPLQDDTIIRYAGLFTLSDNMLTAGLGYNPIPFTGHLWTIAYEEQFYLLLPVLVAFLMQRTSHQTWITRAAVVIILNGIRCTMVYFNVKHPAIWVLPVTHFESMLIGIVIGFGKLDFLLKRIPSFLLGIFGLFFFGLVWLLPPISQNSFLLSFSYTFIGIFSAFVLLSVLKNGILKKILSYKVFVFLGKRSYGLYIFHLVSNGIVAYLVKYFPVLKNDLFSFVASLAVCIIFSVISYRFVEMPFLKIKRRYEVVHSRPV
ncbi:MAG: acyltransferase [Cyclobacteriaceae bacterium]|nr:acyltransferase [Cyclobacteriaceae bacterium]